MTYSWFQTVFPIALIFSFRMLGLFMLIPVFTLLGPQLNNATPALLGLALGAYGLTQGLLQIPFGMLSDRFGRKPIITLGLLFFAIGSLLGALSHSIYTMILARILQGMGAIGSVLIALLADLTPAPQRTKAMAIIGVGIGFSFSLAMILSPLLTASHGLASIFYVTTLLAMLGLILLYYVIPPVEQKHAIPPTAATLHLLKTSLGDKSLVHLDIGIFLQHWIFTASFYAIPLILQEHLAQGHVNQQWHFYLPLLLASFFLMFPFIFLAERRGKMKFVFSFAIFLTGLTQFFLIFLQQHWLAFCTVMLIYFLAFNFLEASLPSLVSKQALPSNKGTAMGIYSSSQFLGIFLGGSFAGLFYAFKGTSGLFLSNAFLGLIWFSLSLRMYFSSDSLATNRVRCS